MLKKLMKHEFRATSRIMWPVFAGMLALSLVLRGVIFADEHSAIPAPFNWVYTLLMIVFAVGIVALCLAPLALSALRFERHVLRDEGYLTMTLPVSFHKILLSKLLVSAVWYALSFLVLVLVCLLAALSVNDWAEIVRSLPMLCDALFRQNAIPVPTLVLWVLELLFNAVAYITVVSLVIYASYAVGFSFNRHKGALTSVILLAFIILSSYAMIGLTFKLLDIETQTWTTLAGIQTLHLTLLTFLLVELLVCAVFYAVTWYFATKRLNLE